jgi:hypothetical protein
MKYKVSMSYLEVHIQYFLIFKKKIKFWNFEIFDYFCNLIGRLEMKSRLVGQRWNTE